MAITPLTREKGTPPKANVERPIVRPEERAERHRKQAGRTSYKPPVNMGLGDTNAPATTALTGAGAKLDTKG